MKTKILSLLAVTITAALISQPMLADITYQYTGNPFTDVSGPPYTTSDFVTAMVTLANPLPPNTPLTLVTPLHFSMSDGVQTITNLNASNSGFTFATGPTGTITLWDVFGQAAPGNAITSKITQLDNFDIGNTSPPSAFGFNRNASGAWTAAGVPDAGSSLALLSLSLTALGVAARQFKRAAA